MKSTINSSLFVRMELKAKQYVAPCIEVIEQVYNEGLMTTISTIDGGGDDTTGGGLAKPGGDWGDNWGDPITQNDSWGMDDYKD